jgi:cytochrome c-type biogenesis protein
MTELMATLNRLVEGAPLAALLGAFAWGILSVLLSPCHLVTIPLVVGYISGQRDLTARKAVLTSSVFAAGTLLTIAILGVLTALLGRMLGDVGGWANWLVAGIFFLMGLNLLDVVPLPFSGPEISAGDRRGILAAFGLGFLFGVALGPCTFAFMAPVLAVAFRAGATAPLFAAALLLAFGLGHCAVIAAAGSSAAGVPRYLRWTGSSRAPALFRKACGVLVLLGGLYFVWTAR